MSRFDEISKLIEFQSMTRDELLAVADFIEIEFHNLNRSETEAFDTLKRSMESVNADRVKLLAIAERMDFLLRRAVEGLE